ncbi:MAG: DUF1015 domain-containing protein [Oscillospiraceae bacterium]|nr:DUF1015 domain-containing protein [Oscillospiraceae bacterium]
MNDDVFSPADILLPSGVDMAKWSVIACDQYSAQPDYWERVAKYVGESPSTLKLILPEAYLDGDTEAMISGVRAAMRDYATGGLFDEVGDSFIYIERDMSGGGVRRGLIGAVDLEQYSYTGAKAPVLASEGTTPEKLPARIAARRGAQLESPHVLAFIDDSGKTVLEPLAARKDALPCLYDFELMEGGGRVTGMKVEGADARAVSQALRELQATADPFIVIGDGNHSLASAKVCWDEIKGSLSAKDRQNHPARRALLEINNVYDESIIFEAIHRVLFDVEPSEFIAAMEKSLPAGSDYTFGWHAGEQSGEVRISAGCVGDALELFGGFLDGYLAGSGSRIDYIHGDAAVLALSKEEGRVGVIMPAIEKSQLFATVAKSGAFPKKSFSVGSSVDKRYYLECRSIHAHV